MGRLSTRQRRWLIGGAAALLFLIAASWLVLRDDPEPDEPDQLTRSPVKEQGPFPESLIDALIGIDSDLPTAPNWHEIAPEPRRDGLVSAPAGISVRRRNAEILEQMGQYFEGEAQALDRVEAALSLEITGWIVLGPFDGPISSAEAITEVFNQLGQRAQWNRGRGDIAADSRDLDLRVRLGERLIADGVDDRATLDFAAIHLRRSIESLETLLRDGSIDPEVEARILARPPALERETRVARRCLEGEYFAWSRYADKLHHGEGGSRRSASLEDWPPIAFKRNRTQARFIGVLQAMVAEADRPPPIRRIPPEIPFGDEDLLRRILVNMNSGEFLINGFSRELVEILHIIDWVRLHENALRLFVALRRYERLHGALPSDLDALLSGVPELAALPLDPYSGEPFRYDPELRIFWSVGRNGIDDGAPGWAEVERTGIRPRYKNPLDEVWWLPLAPVPWGSAPR